MVVSEFESYKEFYTWESNLYKAHRRVRILEKEKRTLSYIFHEIHKNCMKGILKQMLFSIIIATESIL